MNADDISTVLKFWFEDHGEQQWYMKDAGFDRLIHDRFKNLHNRISIIDIDDLIKGGEHSLAAIIVLDQFSRNMFRDTEQAFAYDDQALALAKKSVQLGFDQNFDHRRRAFFYLPFMHSENLDDQKHCVDLFAQMDQNLPGYDYAIQHLNVIKEFGRFPHRNKILGRINTPEEDIYLSQPSAGF